MGCRQFESQSVDCSSGGCSGLMGKCRLKWPDHELNVLTVYALGLETFSEVY